ncbi:MAG: LPP20 family lipoprotein [Gammaproteobacteria bacterium]|nr:LPP20 family lipoprotein [Gammaproteobacteria bacterium]
MNRLIMGLTTGVVALGLVACGGKDAVKPEMVADCVFPNTEKAAPGWVCDEPVPGLDVQAVGIAEPSKAGVSFMKDMAAADARGRLAEQTKVRVSKMVKKYLGTTGVADSETVDAAASSTLKTVTSEELVGSKVYKSRTGPNGRMFVLLGLDAAAAERIVAKAAKTSMNNDKALWQQFVAKKSYDEMAADIAKSEP